MSIMHKEKKSDDPKIGDESEEAEAIELVLFQVSECYVYIVSLTQEENKNWAYLTITSLFMGFYEKFSGDELV